MLEYLTKEAPVRWGGGFERSDNLVVQNADHKKYHMRYTGVQDIIGSF
ncbi:MAG TPA: hypothetical protein VLD84_08230 [Nitrososphaeraceae archaeon]|nr:hypothetical protein [Nitrososphaeraceae archaeon]